ncbi:hypothetical protein M2103_000792 [Ereboglobus sp. PH5-5]|nr:hypothetical protein [Ereboglobus sp. PH5-5]
MGAIMKVSHKRILIGAGVGLLLIVGGLVFRGLLDADKRLDSAWTGFIASIESLDAGSTADCLADDYSDSWGYTQQTLSVDLRRMMASFEKLELALHDVSVTRTGRDAEVSVRVKMTASGHGYVSDAARQVNGLTEPFVLRLKQGDSFPWSWHIVRIEQAEFDAKRYGARRQRSFSWPF